MVQRPFVALLLWAVVVRASLAAGPRLDHLQPQGGQRGAEVVVTLIGSRIGQDPQDVLFYDPGIALKGIERIDDNQAKATFVIDPDCQPGIHGLRVRTATGLTNLRTFHVGALPEVVETEPNNAFESPQPVDFGVAVNGVVTSEDVDYLAIEAHEGERISVEVEGLRLGRTFFDPAVTVFDDKRFEVASADDSPLLQQDSYCCVLAPKSGKYVIELRETSYRGDDASTYRLHIGKFPRPAAAFPGGGRPGQPLEIKWLGDPAGEKIETVTLPNPAPLGFRISASDQHGAAPTGTPLRAVDLPNIIEVEPNKEMEQATRGEVPGAFCGVIGEAEDGDRFSFTAKKGEVFDFNLIAREIRSPLDGVLRLRNAKGEVIAAADDNGGKPDAYFRFTIPEDGQYVVEVEDHLRQGQPTYLYRVEVSRPAAAVDLALEERIQYEATEIVVPQGNRMAVMVAANRADVAGELNVALGELPPGVAQEANPLAADYNRLPVLLRAAPDAPLAGVLTTVTAELADKSQPIASRFKQQTWLVRGSNNVPVWNHWAERAAVAVVQPAPFTISIVEPKAPIVQSGSKDLKVVAERRDGFDGRIAVRLLYDPPGLSSHQGIGIEPGQTEALIPLTTAGNAWARDWKVIVVAEADVNGPVRTSTEFATLKLVPPYLAMTFPPVATEQGKSVDYSIALSHTTPFDGPAKVELVGLPPGVATTPQEITKDSTEVKFPLSVAADARVGHHRQLYCQVTVIENGEPVVHTIGTGELRIDEPLKPADPAQTAQQPAAAAGESS
ncbi:MAG: peptidase [Planctomycetota bacterium]|nr:MAG: peptidase [Planctomycetota bacterium]